MVLAPDEVIKAQDLVPTPAIQCQARNGGLHACTGVFVIWCLMWTKTSINRAVGMAMLGSVLRSLIKIFVGAPNHFDTAIDYTGLILSSVAAYASLTNHGYANVAMIGFGLALLLHGLYLVCFPKSGIRTTTNTSDCLAFFIGYRGEKFFSNGVLFTALGMGHDIFKAFAFSLLASITGDCIYTDILTFLSKPIKIVTVVLMLYSIASLMVI